MSEIKNGGLDQYGAKPLEQQQFGTAGIEGVNTNIVQPIPTYTAVGRGSWQLNQ